MSMDRTLRTHGGLAKNRSVLTRTERIARLVDEDKFDPETGRPFGLPKTKVRHSKAGTKAKKVEEKPEEGVEGEQAEGVEGNKTAESVSSQNTKT